MEAVKLRSYEKLEEENKELKTMMRKLSHEMGNALTLLGGSIYYLEHPGKSADTKMEIDSVKEDYAYICSLFNNLRDYNHFEAVDKKNITLTDILECIENSFDRLNKDEDVQLKVDRAADTDLAYIYADITKVRQVIINILKNSMEAMSDNISEKGKEIFVRITMEYAPADKRITNGQMSKKAVAHIELRDNGKGISEKNISEIFQPMYTFGKKQGAGLGLAIVKKIIEDHRGKIKAVSAQGTGTAMHIYLPISKTMKSQIAYPTF